MKKSRKHLFYEAQDPKFNIDLSTEPYALELVLLTLAASRILPKIPDHLPTKDAARDIQSLFLNIRELFLTKPEQR